MSHALFAPISLFLQQLVNGLTLGSLYALVAVGFSLFYGARRLVDFAHGEVCMLGAFFLLSLLTGFFGAVLPLLPALLATVAACALFGALLDLLFFRPLRRVGRLTGLVITIGIAIFLQNLVLLIWGGGIHPFPGVGLSGALFEPLLVVGGIAVSRLQLVILAGVFLLLTGLKLLLYRTGFGRALRAIDQDRTAAALVGVDVERVILGVFALGSALGGIAGLLAGLYASAVSPALGWTLTIKGFAAAVLGGLGSVPGAILGGAVLGLAEVFGAGYIASSYSEGLVAVLVLLILWFKPNGLAGGFLERRFPCGRSSLSMSSDDHLFSNLRFWLPLLVGALVLPWLPLGTLGASVIRIATLTLVYMVLAQGLNIVSGFVGRIDLGYVGFFAIGAYTAGVVMVYGHLNFWLALPLALLHGALWGGLRGLLSRKLSGYGFALFSFAFTALILLVIRNESWLTGGVLGLSGLARPSLFTLSLDPFQLCYYLIIILLLAVLGVLWQLRRSRLGRAWYAICEDETAARCVGIDADRCRLVASVLSGAVGALAGAFYAGWLGFVHPDMFTFRESLLVLCLVAFGGPGSLFGPLLGALILVPASEFLGLILPAGLSPVRYLVFALLLVVVLRWRPGGLLPPARPGGGEDG